MTHWFANVCSLFLLNTLFTSSCPLLSQQFARSSPAGCTPSSDSTTRSPWTPWPPSAGLCTPPSSHPVTPPIMRCSLSSRCAPPSGVPSSACFLTTSGRSLSTSTTRTEVGAWALEPELQQSESSSYTLGLAGDRSTLGCFMKAFMPHLLPLFHTGVGSHADVK